MSSIQGVQNYGDSGSFPVRLDPHVAPTPHLPRGSFVSPSNTSEAEEKRLFSHSVGILAGLTVLTVAISVVVIALTILAPGVPQSILLGIAFSGVSLGGFTVMKNLVYTIRDLIAPKMKEKTRLKSALAVGAGFSGFGIAMKLGSNFIPGGYGNILGNLGTSAYSKGMQSTLVGLSHFLYMKFARSEKVARGEALTPEEVMREARKLHNISLSLAVLGVGFIVLGVLLAIIGTVMLSGIPAMIALVFAPPLISVGISTVLRTLLKSSLSKWQNFLQAKAQGDLLIDSSLKDIRSQRFSSPENEQGIQDREDSIKVVSEEEDYEDYGIPRTYENISESIERLSDVEVDQRLSLTSRQKVIFALTTILLLASCAALLASGFGGLVGVQAFLVASIGSTVASTSLPLVSSGISYVAFQLKARLKISRLRWKEMREKRHVRKSLEEAGMTYTNKEFDKAWEVVYKRSVLETDQAIREEVRAFEKGKEVNSAIFGGILIGVGVGIMLLTLIPVFTPAMSGFLSIGGAALSIGGAILLQKLVSWLYDELVKLHDRWGSRQKRLYSKKSKPLQVIDHDILVDGIAADNASLFDGEDLDFDVLDS